MILTVKQFEDRLNEINEEYSTTINKFYKIITEHSLKNV
jgi:hypothetical protein